MSDILCRHCHRRIRYVNFALGPAWTHVDNSFEGYTSCRLSVATPPEGVKPQWQQP
ncbi:hypothetical protein AB0H71_13800 [Nocardia sp. NPDC050697]|uniref:hypothetical protein n=1 Tax=Nocardia sp. NPDC050697 TaxID=3155158 RepID=UPI0033D4133D